MRNISYYWYSSSLMWLTGLLLPLSWLFRFIIVIRRTLYRLKLKKTYRLPVPVIVVGNITVGGTGKTPFVIWLANELKQAGWKPGIVSRGVGAVTLHQKPYWVDEQTDPTLVGDEAVLLKQRSGCPVVVGVDRVAAAKTLLAKSDCNIVISDDGLQHYRLGRDLEIVIVDGARGFGNGRLLPAGPLREPISRLNAVNFVVYQTTSHVPTNHPPSPWETIRVGGSKHHNTNNSMQLQGDQVINLQNGQSKPLASFKDTTLHAIAAIGNPNRFFKQLRLLGVKTIEHPFPDHYLYQAKDLQFNDGLPILMTEKDAVKCRAIASDLCWYLPVTVSLDLGFKLSLFEKVSLLSSYPVSERRGWG